MRSKCDCTPKGVPDFCDPVRLRGYGATSRRFGVTRRGRIHFHPGPEVSSRSAALRGMRRSGYQLSSLRDEFGVIQNTKTRFPSLSANSFENLLIERGSSPLMGWL